MIIIRYSVPHSIPMKLQECLDIDLQRADRVLKLKLFQNRWVQDTKGTNGGLLSSDAQVD